MAARRILRVAVAASVLLGGCRWGAPASQPAERVSPRDWAAYGQSEGRGGPGPGTDAAGSRSQAAPLPDQPDLSDYLTYAAMHSPRLRAAFERWRAAVERTEQVRTLPDPKFTYAYYFEEVETRVGAQRQSFGLAQTFPWFGKLALRGDAAAEAAQAQWHRFQAAKLTLYRQVKSIYYEYAYLARAVSVTEDNLKLLRQVEDLVRTRYKAAAAGHPDLIRLQVEVGKLADRVATLKELRRPIVSRLNAAIGRSDAEAEPPWPNEIVHEPVAASWTQLAAWMHQANPQLKALDRETAEARDKIDLARKDYYPDVTVGVTYIDTSSAVGAMHPSDSGKDPVIGMITVNIPIWWNKLAAGVREAQSRHAAAVRSRRQKAHDLTAALRMAVYHLEDAQRKIALYRRTLIPKARESLKVTQTSFAAGRSGFTDLIDAQRILLEFGLSLYRALADHAIRRAEIEQIVGRELPTKEGTSK